MFSSCHLPWNLNRKKASLKHMFTSNCVNLASVKWTTFVFFIWFYPQLDTDTRNYDWQWFGWTVQRCRANFGDPRSPKQVTAVWVGAWFFGAAALKVVFLWVWTIFNRWQSYFIWQMLYLRNIFCNLITRLSQSVFYWRIFYLFMEVILWYYFTLYIFLMWRYLLIILI